MPSIIRRITGESLALDANHPDPEMIRRQAFYGPYDAQEMIPIRAELGQGSVRNARVPPDEGRYVKKKMSLRREVANISGPGAR